jgi:hypothetical protein
MRKPQATPQPAPKRPSFLESLNSELAARGMLPGSPYEDARSPCPSSCALSSEVKVLHKRVDAVNAEQLQNVRSPMLAAFDGGSMDASIRHHTSLEL